MSLTEAAVQRLKSDYPSLTIVARRTGQSSVVDAVRVSLKGVRGGPTELKCWYELIIETANIDEYIPPVWVASPADSDIKHVNIWPARESFCKWTGAHLPSFCWYEFASTWSDAKPQNRTLGSALELAKQFLNSENHDSLARRAS